MRGGVRGARETGSDTRGLSPQVGFVLLVGMVLLGAALVAVTGWVLIDSLEAESDAEVTYSAIETTQHGITTASRTGQTQAVSVEDGTFRDEGTVNLTWWDTHQNDFTADTTVEETLGAIVYETSDGTIAYQGGGAWEEHDDGYRAYSDPPIRYDEDDDVIEVELVTLSQDDLDGSEPTARPNPDSDFPERIRNVTDTAMSLGYNNFTLSIESEYHEGWEAYFESELEPYDDIDVHSSGETVELVVENATETSSSFLIESDGGLVNGSDNVYVDAEESDPPTLAVDVENVGEERADKDVDVVVEDEHGNTVFTDDEQVSLDGWDSTTVTFEVDESGLDHGGRYEYDFVTEDGDRLDVMGRFYYASVRDPYLELTNPVVDGQDASDAANPVSATEENVTIEIDVQNVGATNLSADPDRGELELTLEADEHPESDPYNVSEEDYAVVHRNVSEAETATWELNRTRLLQGDHEFTVETADGETVTGYFTVEQGVAIEDTELVIDPGTEVNISIIGSELSSYGSNWNRWLPTYVDVVTQPVDENGAAVGDPVRHDASDGLTWADTNLNRHDRRLEIYEYDFTTDERVSLMLQATSYLGCVEWDYYGYEDDYHIYDCPTGYEDDKHVELTAETGTEESNVRVLNRTRNTVPELEPGVDIQMRADELLERDGVDVDVWEGEDGVGHLDLDDDETVFLFELTHHPEQYNIGPTLDEDTEWTNERYWDEAFARQGDDPNFNDAIAHVEFDVREPESYEASGDFSPGAGTPVSFGTGESADHDDGGLNEPTIDVGSDEIIIG